MAAEEAHPAESSAHHRALAHRESEHAARLRRTTSAAHVLEESARRAFGGGVAGAMAMALQVSTLMWLRTTVAFQYRYGGGTADALRALYRQGGVRRFYQGVLPALLQAPLSRFGDTAANSGALSLLHAHGATRELPTGVKTLASAAAATVWRVSLMPLDTLKSMMQVEGAAGVEKLRAKLRAGGPPVLFHGASGLVASAFAGHYFWYGTFNALDASLPKRHSDLLFTLGRNAGVGFCASAVSDTLTNSIRVVKTFRQTSETPISYGDAARTIIRSDGVRGLFGRGLVTRLLANGVQAAVFSATWKYLEKVIAGHVDQQYPRRRN
ncbi:hypothetical protein AB1Y20_005034 [Prymnesium parvum]|uniref:ADP,ATP carrier protein n=1 Tax=Prymnesium parvum TaxID=97485 RepID=A0AB34J5E0_PRYPA